MTAPEPPPTPTDPAVRNHELLCLAALLVLVLVLVSRGFGVASGLVLLIGSGGILGRWRTALPLLLLMLVMVMFGVTNILLAIGGLASPSAFRSGYDENDAIGDFLLCIAVLAYAAGQYRLLSLTRSPLPEDPRLRPKPGGLATPKIGRIPVEDELVVLLITLPMWTLLATVAWELLPDDWRNIEWLPRAWNWRGIGLLPRVWRLLALVWLLVLPWLLGRLLYRVLKSRWSSSPEEAALYCQDVLWRVTRRERRWLHRWWVWARLRGQRRKE